ncbi:hypothetical protein ACMT1E_12445 [Sphingomonas flavalba]|uniref:hypothetical protein n=1 Tax=Sphingomonas flavalba TaxID=2559804 RepID=UPI0039E0EDEA
MLARHLSGAMLNPVGAAMNPSSSAHLSPFVVDRASIADATALIAKHGDDAGFEAAARADRLRAIGNVLGFCRWRQIERLVVLLSAGTAAGTIH